MTNQSPRWDDILLRMSISDAMQCDAEYVMAGEPVRDDEVYISALTMLGLIAKIIQWAKPLKPSAVTYREVLMHNGEYHAFVGVRNPQK
jgi:hypothetical protein